MKAIVQERFGPPDVLQLVDTGRPEAGAGHVLVRVHAAALNPYNWHIMRGDPLIARLMGEVGLNKPKARVAGVDAAGRVEAAGANVRGLRHGDEVLGFCRGAFAEYARAEADTVVPKPVSLTFEQAAAVPMAGTTALRGIRDVGAVRAGHRVLVNGAAGGVGTYAVQIAAALGAEVTGVCSTRNAGLVRSIGTAHVIDYTTEDFTDGRARYDVILDRTYPLTGTAEGLRRVEQGHARGKVVITVAYYRPGRPGTSERPRRWFGGRRPQPQRAAPNHQADHLRLIGYLRVLCEEQRLVITRVTDAPASSWAAAIAEAVGSPGTVYGVVRGAPATGPISRQAAWHVCHLADRQLGEEQLEGT